MCVCLVGGGLGASADDTRPSNLIAGGRNSLLAGMLHQGKYSLFRYGLIYGPVGLS